VDLREIVMAVVEDLRCHQRTFRILAVPMRVLRARLCAVVHGEWLTSEKGDVDQLPLECDAEREAISYIKPPEPGIRRGGHQT